MRFVYLFLSLVLLAACAGQPMAQAGPVPVAAAQPPQEEPQKGGPPVATVQLVSTKKAFTSPAVVAITPPAAGNFPQSLYKYAISGLGARYTQTLEWSPAVEKVFATGTVYTAILTLESTDRTRSFAGMALEDISGLTFEGVVESFAEMQGDNMAIHMVFEKTGSKNAEPQLLFFDEFDGKELDLEKWAYAPNWDRQGRSTWDKNLVSVSDGYLKLGLVKDTALGAKKTDKRELAENWVRGGAVRTLQTDHRTVIFDNTYGYYEARIKFPEVKGTWGAFWLMSLTFGQPGKDTAIKGTEIDIIESIHNENREYNAAIHWGGYDARLQSRSSRNGGRRPVNIYDGKFHTYGLEWTPTEYIFYVDGKEFWRYKGDINQNPNYVKLSVEGARFTHEHLFQ